MLEVVTLAEHEALVVELVGVQQLPDAVHKLHHEVFQLHGFAAKRLFALLTHHALDLGKLVGEGGQVLLKLQEHLEDVDQVLSGPVHLPCPACQDAQSLQGHFLAAFFLSHLLVSLAEADLGHQVPQRLHDFALSLLQVFAIKLVGHAPLIFQRLKQLLHLVNQQDLRGLDRCGLVVPDLLEQLRLPEVDTAVLLLQKVLEQFSLIEILVSNRQRIVFSLRRC